MASEYNQERPSEYRSELDEPRRTTEPMQSDDLGMGEQQQQQRRQGGEYGGMGEGEGEGEVPRHKLHSEDEPLPKPTPGTYDEDMPSEERVTPKPTGEGEYGDAPKSTGGYQEYRESQQPQYDESPMETKPRSAGMGTGGATGEGYADPSSAFPGAPIDRKVEEPGYGYEQNTSEPAMDSATTPGTGAPKKESLISKIKDKLPGHHKSSADTVEPDTAMDTDPTGASPKKGLMTKIKEKLPGHHSSTAPAE